MTHKTLEERVTDTKEFLNLCYTENEQDLIAKLKLSYSLIYDLYTRIKELEKQRDYTVEMLNDRESELRELHNQEITEDEVEAAAKALYYATGDKPRAIKFENSSEERLVCMWKAKASLEAARNALTAARKVRI